MYNLVIRWQKTYIPHSIVEVLSLNAAIDSANSKEFGAPLSINIFEEHCLIASLRTVK